MPRNERGFLGSFCVRCVTGYSIEGLTEMDTLRLSTLVCVSTAGCAGLANLYNRANSSEWSSHTDGTKISHLRWDEKIPREGFQNPQGGTKRSQRRDEMIPTEGFPNPHVVNKDSQRRDEIKLRKNEMKLRRNQMKLRRNCFSSTWRIKNSHVELEVPHVAIRMLGLSAGEVFGEGGGGVATAYPKRRS